MDRGTFAERQAAMTANWYELVRQRVGDVEAYIAGRQAAYLDRWREAARFIADGSRVLDVGGGNLYPGLLQYLKQRRLEYFYLDVDPAAVDASRQLAASFGFDPARFGHGFNDRFDFAADSFDAVFSSHCVEHSIDLRATLRELNRVIRPGGNLLMAVPLGWETNPEHPYFLAADHWAALVEDAGFDLRVAQVGREYPEVGVDLFIAARKSRPYSAAPRLDPAEWLKDSYRFIPFDDSAIHASGQASADRQEQRLHLRGADWRVEVELPPCTEVLPVLHRHDWSGIVQVEGGGSITQHDLFSWYGYVQPVRHALGAASGSQRLTLRPCGRNPCSFGTEAVLYGVMVR